MTIIKHGNKYAVVLTYKDETGTKKQKWIAAENKEKAKELSRSLAKAAGHKEGAEAEGTENAPSF
jgi:hypothetical protein